MKTKRPADDVHKRVDRLLVRHKTLKRAREHSTEELQNGLLKRVEQYTKNLPHDLPRIKKEELAYICARLAALEKDNKRLRKKVADSTKRLFEGSLAETLLWYKEPTEENQLKIKKAKALFWQQRQDEYEHRSRDGSPLQYGSIGWLAPMPVWSEKDPYGYCQATGKNRTAIRRFLDSIDAKVVGKEKKVGRGRPLQFYPVTTNLRVLDHWLKKWVGQTPDKVGRMAVLTFDGVIGRRERLAGGGRKSNVSPTQTKRFVRIIQQHLRRVRKGLSVPYISAVADGILECSDPL